jgi:hypothetical protein
MLLPTQTAPIDRANRAVTMRASARGMMPSQIGPDILCEACSLLPPPFSLICKAICNKVL